MTWVETRMSFVTPIKQRSALRRSKLFGQALGLASRSLQLPGRLGGLHLVAADEVRVPRRQFIPKPLGDDCLVGRYREAAGGDVSLRPASPRALPGLRVHHPEGSARLACRTRVGMCCNK